MANDFLAVAKAIKEWADAPIKTMLIFCCVSGLAIFLPHTWKTSMGVGVFVDSHIAWIWCVFLFSCLYLAFTLVESRVMPHFAKSSAGKQMDKKMLALLEDERQILTVFIQRGQTSIAFTEARYRKDNAAFMSLLNKGILRAGGFSWDSDCYHLTHEANESMRKPNVRASIQAGRE